MLGVAADEQSQRVIEIPQDLEGLLQMPRILRCLVLFQPSAQVLIVDRMPMPPLVGAQTGFVLQVRLESPHSRPGSGVYAGTDLADALDQVWREPGLKDLLLERDDVFAFEDTDANQGHHDLLVGRRYPNLRYWDSKTAIFGLQRGGAGRYSRLALRQSAWLKITILA